MANNNKRNVPIEVTSNKSSKGANLTGPMRGQGLPYGKRPVNDSHSIHESIKKVPLRDGNPDRGCQVTSDERGPGLKGNKGGVNND